MRIRLASLVVLALSCSQPPAPQQPSAPPTAQDRSWIEPSNQNAQLLLQVQAKFQPEFAARTGVTGLDDRIADFAPGHLQRLRDAVKQVQGELEKRLAAEHNPLVAQVLQILIDATRRQIKGSELREKLQVPYYNLPQLVFGSMRSLLDPQVAAERRPAALVRLRKYLGMEGDQPSLVQLAETETSEGLQKWLLPPSRIEIENDLDTAEHLLDGVDRLFKEFKIAGAEPALTEMHKQLGQYLQFVRAEL